MDGHNKTKLISLWNFVFSKWKAKKEKDKCNDETMIDEETQEKHKCLGQVAGASESVSILFIIKYYSIFNLFLLLFWLSFYEITRECLSCLRTHRHKTYDFFVREIWFFHSFLLPPICITFLSQSFFLNINNL